MTREELEEMGMTDAEIEALLEEDDPDEKKTVAELMKKGDDDGEDEEPADDDTPTPEDTPEPAPADEPAPAEDTPPAEDPAPAPVDDAPKPPAARDFDAEYAAVEEKRSKIEADYLDGSLEESEYRKTLSELAAQERAITREQTRHEIAAEQHVQHLQSVARQFMAEHGDYQKYPARLQLLQDAANRLESSNPSMDPRAVLDAAHKQVCESLGIAIAPSAKPAQARGAGAANVDIPPTLGGLPAAGNDNGDNGLFASLDRLTGDDLEEALDRLTPEQQERYYGGAR